MHYLYDAVKELLDKDVKMYYIPYHSIGKSSGLLPGMTLDYMIIKKRRRFTEGGTSLDSCEQRAR